MNYIGLVGTYVLPEKHRSIAKIKLDMYST